ncbi:MAG: hypothetical protein V3T72_09795 [Thermoanaerobaculia bacterium]
MKRWTHQLVLIALALASAAGATTVAEIGGCAGTVAERTLAADPTDYLSVVAGLQPGDLLQLEAGTYADGLPVIDLHGAPDRCIVIEGPEAGAAVFTGRDCCNTISIRDSSYVVVRGLELDGEDRLGDGVKAESESAAAHHLTLEDLVIRGHGAGQQIVGINTKSPAWNWVIRQNVIEAAGTGIYLGNSDGEQEFVNGLIEHNLIVDTLGYNLQIKHQNGRDVGLGMPADATTVIRHNVFSKAENAAGGGNARPNLLLGHWPLAGPGADDDYLVYGNFFHQNPTDEALLQAEGNVIVYGNLFLNDVGSAVFIQPHNDVPKRIRVFQNTVVASATGLQVVGGDAGFEQRLIGNASFAAVPVAGGTQLDNVTDGYAAASAYLVNPTGVLTGEVDRLDLYPLSGTLTGPALDLFGLESYADWDLDFNGTPRAGVFRGSYAGEGVNPGWLPALERKPELAVVIFADGFESGDVSAWVD